MDGPRGRHSSLWLLHRVVHMHETDVFGAVTREPRQLHNVPIRHHHVQPTPVHLAAGEA